MLTFCPHPACLDRELRFLGEVELSIWQQSNAIPNGYAVLLHQFREEFSQQAVHREP